MTTFSPADYLDLSKTAHAALFEGVTNAWEILPKIGPYLAQHLQPGFHGEKRGEFFCGDRVFIGRGTIVEPGVVIHGPAWIGEDCHLRPGAYIRENVIVGDGAVLGNSCEFKNSLLFNSVQVPHFSYVGDSILGYAAHLGAGVILSNFKLAGDEISVMTENGPLKTGLRKFGALLGDRAEIGCNSVLNPGSVIGRDTALYPGTLWTGVLPEKTIVKNRPQYSIVPKRMG